MLLLLPVIVIDDDENWMVIDDDTDVMRVMATVMVLVTKVHGDGDGNAIGV